MNRSASRDATQRNAESARLEKATLPVPRGGTHPARGAAARGAKGVPEAAIRHRAVDAPAQRHIRAEARGLCRRVAALAARLGDARPEPRPARPRAPERRRAPEKGEKKKAGAPTERQRALEAAHAVLPRRSSISVDFRRRSAPIAADRRGRAAPRSRGRPSRAIWLVGAPARWPLARRCWARTRRFSWLRLLRLLLRSTLRFRSPTWCAAERTRLPRRPPPLSASGSPPAAAPPPGHRPPVPSQDEIFHVPQTQRYCLGEWRSWDPKITTFPGSYVFAWAVAQATRGAAAALEGVGRWVGLGTAGGVGCWGGGALASFSAVASSSASLSSSPWWCGVPVLRSAPALLAVGSALLAAASPPPLGSASLLRSLAVLLFPPFFFYASLAYTDSSALFWLLAARAALLRGQGVEGRRRARWGALAGVCSALATLSRQTNAVWVAFLVGEATLEDWMRRAGSSGEGEGGKAGSAAEAVPSPKRRRRGTPPSVPSSPLAAAASLLAGLARSPRVALPRLLLLAFPSVVPVLAFGAFLVWNGGEVVVGDRSNHRVARHWAQLGYLGAALLAAFWPWGVPCGGGGGSGGNGGSRGRGEETAERRGAGGAGSAARPRARPGWRLGGLAALALGLSLCLSRGAIAHPFLLADNRHHMSTLWRRALSKTRVRAALGPLAAFGYALAHRAVAGDEGRGRGEGGARVADGQGDQRGGDATEEDARARIATGTRAERAPPPAASAESAKSAPRSAASAESAPPSDASAESAPRSATSAARAERPPPAVESPPSAPLLSPLAPSHALWWLGFAGACVLTLVPSPLLEPRYLIPPVALLLASVPTSDDDAETVAGARRTPPPFRLSPLRHRLALSAAAFAAVDAVALFVFLKRPYVWVDGTIARKVW